MRFINLAVLKTCVRRKALSRAKWCPPTYSSLPVPHYPSHQTPGWPISAPLLLSFRTHYSHLCIQQRAVYLSSALQRGVRVCWAGFYLRSLRCDRDHKYWSRVVSSSTCLKGLSLFLSSLLISISVIWFTEMAGCITYFTSLIFSS